MNLDLDRLLTIARDAVKLGADLVKTSTPHVIREKGDRDIVTEVDIKVEEEVRAYLQRMTPEIGFLGEEEGQSQTGSSELVWTLDPIDGTSNFAHGLPLCAVCLGLVHNGHPIVAAITAPFLDLHYHAATGRGAFVNGDQIHTSRTADLARAIVSIGDYAVGEEAESKNKTRLRLTMLLADRVERVRMFGSAVLDLAWSLKTAPTVPLYLQISHGIWLRVYYWHVRRARWLSTKLVSGTPLLLLKQSRSTRAFWPHFWPWFASPTSQPSG